MALIATLPLIVVLLLLVFRHMAADRAGIVGWFLAAGIAAIFFETPARVIALASLSGLTASLPISLVVMFSILQMTYMQEVGAIDRISALIKGVARDERAAQIIIINIGFGTLLTSVGLLPFSILPPIMLSLGFTPFVAIALPTLGFDALCSYAILAIPLVVFAHMTGINIDAAGAIFANFAPILTVCVALAMLYLVGGFRMMRRGLLPAVITGVVAGAAAMVCCRLGMTILTGIVAGGGIICAMLIYVKAKGGKVYESSVQADRGRSASRNMPLVAAVSPWLILMVASALANTPCLPFFERFFERLSLPITIIPGSPEYLRPFWQAYFWILVSTLLSFPILRPTRAQLRMTLSKWMKRAPRPALAAAIYFAIAYIYNHSGKGANWQLAAESHSMIAVLADFCASAFGRFYSFTSPLLGLIGGFISGSETSAVAMLTNLHLAVGEKIGLSGVILGAASAVGAGLATVMCPAKLQNSAASIDRIGMEGSVMRKTIAISVVITLVCALITLIWTL
ncbi:MAG: L-lactate permease [Candidatus Coatesbacteria bacterium]|nr:L-lactate permease [Candidatus Coatesbacteria bacterium]